MARRATGRPRRIRSILTTGEDNPNGARVRFLVDGAALADASAYARVVFIFDGRDADAVARARADYKAAKEGPCGQLLAAG